MQKGRPNIMRRFRPQLLAVGAFAVGLVLGASRSAPQEIIPVAHHGAPVVAGPLGGVPRVGPSYLYPDPTLTPGAVKLLY